MHAFQMHEESLKCILSFSYFHRNLTLGLFPASLAPARATGQALGYIIVHVTADPCRRISPKTPRRAHHPSLNARGTSAIPYPEWVLAVFLFSFCSFAAHPAVAGRSRDATARRNKRPSTAAFNKETYSV